MSNYPPTTNCVSESVTPHQLPPNIPKKFCGASSRQISKTIRLKFLWCQFPPNLKNNPAKNFVVPVPAKFQKQSAVK